ncbi:MULTISPECIES: ComEC/Rec2 family competence protein [unclassified Bacillus (in: firmicutes)]|uniref:ComEC/Rec2 family competence protein n=1 Tax=unclassified Bacillus (in: firmicutes) TaxID=185979 RepID=UPI000BF103D8|nr:MULTISPECIES: ComEC/Rec2 family competence protein [unclassified Bacillus (in: firmicutes)]PEJ56221.1 competence protein ComE [Bacillus sp. AFS002410]PEL10568.1 competence protein ComE [Bacillus sp. AFS017336]
MDKNRKLYSLVISIIIFFTAFFSNNLNTEARTTNYGYITHPLLVYFFDVGQGDSMVMILPNGKTVLIDGGDVEHGGAVIKKLKRLHVNAIDLLVSTHPDIDHIGGLLKVMNSVKISKILDSGKKYNSHSYYLYKKEAFQKNIPISIARLNEKIVLDPNVDITVLNSGKKSYTNNNSSIVLKVKYADISILLTGDIERKAEQRLIKSENIDAQVLKIPHHGSSTSTSEAFLFAVNPTVAILSYDKFNLFGHPHRSVMKRLNHLGIKQYTTDQYGDIELSTNGHNLYIEKQEVLVNP